MAYFCPLHRSIQGVLTVKYPPASRSDLDGVLLRLLAAHRLVAEFDLDGDVMDLEALLELAAEAAKEAVVARRARHDEMRRQRGFRGAHCPDVQVAHALHAGQRAPVARD